MANKSEAKPEFSKIRGFFWPIYTDELKKFLPMGFMMFFILFNYSILRITKDSLIVTAAGPEVIPYLKGLVVLPISIFFVVLYTKLVNVLSRETNFYLIVLFFSIFFAAFGFFLYPNLALVHPDPANIAALHQSYHANKHVFSIYGLWDYSTFYVLAELWGGVMLALLFWQFANEITRTREAKRFYAMFGLLANFALLGALGYALLMEHIVLPGLDAGVDKWGVDLSYSMSLVTISSIIVIMIYRWMHKSVLTDPKYYDAAEKSGSKKPKKPKLSVLESFKYILSSKYLGLIAILIIGYGVSINLIELVWKSQIVAQFPDPGDFRNFMALVQGLTGFATIGLLLF